MWSYVVLTANYSARSGLLRPVWVLSTFSGQSSLSDANCRGGHHARTGVEKNLAAR